MRENHVVSLGKLVANLHSLECLLRAYLLAIAQKSGSTRIGPDYWNLNAGDSVAEDEFTNYDTLGTLIVKFNADVSTRDASLALDSKVVDIRDLIAHGRVASANADLSELKIVKFGPPRNGVAIVSDCAVMNDAWFRKCINLVVEQVQRAHSAFEQYAV